MYQHAQAQHALPGKHGLLCQVNGLPLLSEYSKEDAEVGHARKRVRVLEPQHTLPRREQLPCSVRRCLLLSQLTKQDAEVGHALQRERVRVVRSQQTVSSCRFVSAAASCCPSSASQVLRLDMLFSVYEWSRPSTRFCAASSCRAMSAAA